MKAQTVDAYVKSLPPDQAEIVSGLRALIRAAAPQATESFKWAQPVYEDHGPMIFVKAHTRHVNFGFWRGAQLPDPRGLLEGEGDRMKHVKLTSVKDINKRAFTDFVKAAVKLNRELDDPTKQRRK